MDYKKYNLKEGYKKIYKFYEINNHLMTCWLDIYWRKKASSIVINFLKQSLKQDSKQNLKNETSSRTKKRFIYCDFCIGTGEFFKEISEKLYKLNEYSFVFLGLDFSFEMIKEAKKRRSFKGSFFILADISYIPFKTEVLDMASISLGIRNLRNPNENSHISKDDEIFYKRFSEINRVIKKGGYFIGLETSRPPNKFIRTISDFFTLYVFTNIAKILSNDFSTYTYLAKSIVDFFDSEQFAKFLKNIGFKEVNYHLFTLGVVALHIAKK